MGAEFYAAPAKSDSMLGRTQQYALQPLQTRLLKAHVGGLCTVPTQPGGTLRAAPRADKLRRNVAGTRAARHALSLPPTLERLRLAGRLHTGRPMSPKS